VAASDLLALEALRTIHPQVAETLPNVCGLLTGFDQSRAGSKERQSEQAAFEKFLASAGNDIETVRELCRQLFPVSRRFFDNYHYGPEWLSDWQRFGRVAHPDVLRIYLEGRPPPNVLPMRVVRQAAAALGTPEWESISSLGAEELEGLLSRLRPYVKDLIWMDPSIDYFRELYRVIVFCVRKVKTMSDFEMNATADQPDMRGLVTA
jgi:hypothetical protein